MIPKKIFSAFLILGMILLGCKEEPKKIETEPVTFVKEGELSIFRNEGDSLLVTFDIEIADTAYETQTGLMYRESMDDKQGMFFVFEDEAYHSFYMKNTRFPIDIIFIDKDLKIASFKKNAQPLDESGLSSEVPVQYVLEINAHLSDKYGLQLGDRVRYTDKGS